MSRLPFSHLFMNFAIELSKRSSDKNTKVGCVITNIKNQILGIGYNGEVDNIDNDIANRYKNNYMIHAEMNAITHANCNFSKEKIIMYTTRIPCFHCMKLISQCNVNIIFYLHFEGYYGTFYMASKNNIALIQYDKLFNYEFENCFELKNIYKQEIKNWKQQPIQISGSGFDYVENDETKIMEELDINDDKNMDSRLPWRIQLSIDFIKNLVPILKIDIEKYLNEEFSEFKTQLKNTPRKRKRENLLSLSQN